MAITQETHWDNVGTEPGAGDAEYVAGDQPVSEWDNWFNWSAAKDVENLIAALENVTTGHDHDGANSKQVDGSDVVNTPAGNVVATDVQAAIDELDTEKAPLASPAFTGLVRRYATNGIVAYAGGGQANAIQLSANINEISVCATTGDSVKLPDGVNGREVVVINNGVAALDVFPISGDYINNVLDTAISVPVGYTGKFNCYTSDRWESYIPIDDGMKDAADGVAGLDAGIKLNPLHIPFIESEYHNDFGYIDNFLNKVEVGTGTIVGDTANNEFDFDAPNAADTGYLETLNKHTLDGSPMVVIFNLKNADNHGTARFYIGVHDSVSHAAPVHGYGWRIQLTTFQQRINPFTVNGAGVNVGATIDASDGYLMIIATSSQILFYRNGALVDTLTGSIPPGALNVRVSMGYAGGACDCSIGMLAYKKYL